MSDPGRRQQDRPGAGPARPGAMPPAPANAPAPNPNWGQGPPGRQGYPRPGGGPPYYPPAQTGAPGQLRPGPRPGVARGPLPGGVAPGAPAPGRARPADPTQAVGAQRPRPPAGPSRQAPYPVAAPEPAPDDRPVVVRDVHRRRIVRKLDVWSVFKVSFIFYLCVLLVLIAAGAVLWNVATSFGVITTVDKAVVSLFALRSFQLHPMSALAWGSAIGGALCFLGVLVNVLAAVFYNLVSDLVGGIQVISLSDKER